MDAPTGPLWSQKQAIAYEVALEAINDVIAGYSEQIALEQTYPAPNTARITWLEMRTDQAVSVHHSRSEEHTSELQSLMRISYAVFCLKKKKIHIIKHRHSITKIKTHQHTTQHTVT